MYYQKELDEDNENLLPFPQEYENNNNEQDDDAKLDMTDNYGNESDNEDKIMSEDEGDNNTVIDIQRFNWETKTRSGRVVIPPARLKYFETCGASLDSYKQAVILTPYELNFYYQMK